MKYQIFLDKSRGVFLIGLLVLVVAGTAVAQLGTTNSKFAPQQRTLGPEKVIHPDTTAIYPNADYATGGVALRNHVQRSIILSGAPNTTPLDAYIYWSVLGPVTQRMDWSRSSDCGQIRHPTIHRDVDWRSAGNRSRSVLGQHRQLRLQGPSSSLRGDREWQLPGQVCDRSQRTYRWRRPMEQPRRVPAYGGSGSRDNHDRQSLRDRLRRPSRYAAVSAVVVLHVKSVYCCFSWWPNQI